MKYTIQELEDFSTQVMEAAGLAREDAALFSQSLVYADARGISSHGISRLKTYALRVQSGVIARKACPEVVSDGQGLLLINARHGIGSVSAIRIFDLLMKRAQTQGSCFAFVYNATHFGTGAFLTEHVARQGMIGFVVANAEASVVPIGGTKPMLGTNPLSVAMPAGRFAPPVLDMATSTVARGKVILAKKTGQTIPKGWAVDAKGQDTQDPDLALKGAMLPFGGAKGYGISLFIDLLCSGVSGALNSRTTHSFWSDYEHPQNIGYFQGVINHSLVVDQEAMLERVDGILGEMKACPPAPGVQEVYLPGEPERITHEGTRKEGILLPDSVKTELKELARTYAVADPF